MPSIPKGMTIDKPDPEDDPNASVVDYELMAYSNIKIDYEYVINLIQNIVTPENSDEDITSEERQKKIEEIRQYIEELRKENPKIADIMADVVYEIEQEVRKIQIDWQIVVKFPELVKGLPEERPIFVGEDKVYNSTVNEVLTRHCKKCGISAISIHGLRHTHASLLLFAGVSIASVARRLGHASMTTTQKTYLHIIQELENKDVDLVMRTLSGL